MNNIVSSSVHLARQSCQWLASPGDGATRAALLRWVRAFPRAVMAFAREEEEHLGELMEG